MNARTDFASTAVGQAEIGLTLEQWAGIEALARTVSPAQARWISGYFAGLDAGLARAGDAAPATTIQPRTVTILYGSETGNGRLLAKELAEAAAGSGLSVTVADMASYNVRKIRDEQDLLIIVSTHGEGDPPQPAVPFFEHIESPRAPKLGGLRYSILALGDSTYEFYCEAGKRLDRRLEELGAQRLLERVDCDVDHEEPAGAWSAAILGKLARASAGAPLQSASAAAVSTIALHDRRNPFGATVLEVIAIVGRGSSKETRHVELDLTGSGLAYRPGDSLGLVPSNDPKLVEELLELTALGADREVQVKGETLPIAEALATRFEIATGSPRFLDQWAKLSAAAELARLGPDAGERIRYLERNHVVDIIRNFPVRGIEPDALLAGLRPLQPRLYSIASSQAVVGEEAHLTIVPVRYELHGSLRGGVASTHVADRLQMGAAVPVYVQENPHFRLPADDVPIIMVGPGTGVAPFRAFLQEREIRSAGGRSWLFFGERNLRTDFLYQLEFQQWLKDGVLARLDVAFSRDCTDKVYVQHRMLEQAKELYAWLEEGAHFYVCGDERNMARDVHETLLKVVETAGGRSRAAAEDYARRLVAQHRYQKDVY